MSTDLVAELRSWIGWPEKELDVLLKRAADEIEARATAKARVSADDVRATVHWLAVHAKGLSLIEWDKHSRVLLAAAESLNEATTEPDPRAVLWKIPDEPAGKECAFCKGVGEVGIPGATCRPCNGTGRL